MAQPDARETLKDGFSAHVREPSRGFADVDQARVSRWSFQSATITTSRQIDQITRIVTSLGMRSHRRFVAFRAHERSVFP
jgi:hypothetical protein